MKTKKRNYAWFITVTCALLMASSCNQMPQGNAENGERWFRLNRCNGCHGEKGIGGKGLGAKAPALAGLSLNYRKFINKIRSPNSEIMPAFDPKRLSDQDAADIYLWLQQQ